MARDAELDEVREHVEKATRFNFDETIAKHVDPHGELKTALDDPMLHNPMAELTKTDAPLPLPLPPTAEPEPPPPPAAFLPPPESTAPAPEPHAEPSLPEPPPVKLHEGGR
jgi:sec-independent protein translocase protein TatB